MKLFAPVSWNIFGKLFTCFAVHVSLTDTLFFSLLQIHLWIHWLFFIVCSDNKVLSKSYWIIMTLHFLYHKVYISVKSRNKTWCWPVLNKLRNLPQPITKWIRLTETDTNVNQKTRKLMTLHKSLHLMDDRKMKVSWSRLVKWENCVDSAIKELCRIVNFYYKRQMTRRKMD